MAGAPDQDVLGQAIAWRLRLQSGADEDWGAFVEWLEGDPARSDAYDRVEAADASILATLASTPAAPLVPVAANDGAVRNGPRRARWAAAFAAVAACVLVVVVAGEMLSSRPDRYDVTTAAGEQRTVDLGNGSFAMLNGNTHLILDRIDPRSAELLEGEATFTVRHDSAHPFAVVSGDHRVEDVGTIFNVIRDRDEFSVEVIDGAVVYDPEERAIGLSAGRALRVSNGAQPMVVDADPQSIAGWRRGQLSYVDAPLSRVASDMSRTLGVPIAVDADVATLPLTGSIRIQPDPAKSIGDLALVAGVRARRGDDGWVIETLARAPR